jgi:malate permease and related proteins
VSGQLLATLVALPVGLVAQRTYRSEHLRSRAWTTYFWTLAPLLVFTTFTLVHVDRALLLALAAAILGTWALAVAAYGYALAVGRSRQERGALTLAAAWSNTGFVGIPLTQLAFGHPALALAVVYDRLAWLFPASSLSVVVARLHGRAPAAGRRRRVALLLNPPLWAALLAVSLRAGSVHVAGMQSLQSWCGWAVGPAGFLLLGLALPLERVAHGSDDLGRAAGALALKFAGGPLALFVAGRALGADVPHAFYLLAAMPCAFHLLVLARVYDVRPALMRLLVVGSNAIAVVAVSVGAAIAR